MIISDSTTGFGMLKRFWLITVVKSRMVDVRLFISRPQKKFCGLLFICAGNARISGVINNTVYADVLKGQKFCFGAGILAVNIEIFCT